ncbi:hypothetical protein [Streptomyces sp. 7-21]|jgi:hypothetical protein|uniref:hypothetical protein n=1 Tax=Streptomyces sp. 7-21 TaxID=2802283 RepID=UPI00191D5FDA|nr:hypothetical protein [Streptomyces sp. 7-21]MBL1066623.1 hypothetical protein [Streptomyces sp. 7-21]
MTAAVLEREETVVDPAGEGFGELSLEELRQDRKVYNSEGWLCTITMETGTLICAC